MDHYVSHVLDLALRTLRVCEDDSIAAEQLRGLIAGMGYSVNDRGDLSGIPWEQWQPFSMDGIFELDSEYLKSLLASAFTDNFLMGSYGKFSGLGAPASKQEDRLAEEEWIMCEMAKH